MHGRARELSLQERDAEAASLEAALASARRGTGAVTLIEGTAGIGKSRLLAHAASAARAAGMRCLSARGRELERDYPFGVVVQLYEPCWLTDDSGSEGGVPVGGGAADDGLFAGPARAAARLTGLTATQWPVGSQESFPIVNGLLWMTRHLMRAARERGDEPALVLTVDDVNHADEPSLRFLAFLAERIRRLPIALVVTVRRGEAAGDEPAIAALRAAAGSALLRPAPLSAAAVAAVVRDGLTTAAPALASACAGMTAGNPRLLSELLDELARSSAPSVDALDLTPPSTARRIASLLNALDPSATAVARAVAVGGDRAAPADIGTVAGVDAATVERCADLLAGIGIFTPGSTPAFAQPLIAACVRAEIPSLERARLQNRARELLEADHDDDSSGAVIPADQTVDTAAGRETTVPTAGSELTLSADGGELTLVTGGGELTLSTGGELTLSAGGGGDLAVSSSGGELTVSSARGELTSEQHRRLAQAASGAGPPGWSGAQVRELCDRVWTGVETTGRAASGDATTTLVPWALLFADELERGLEILGERGATAPGTGDAPMHPQSWTCRAWMLYHQGRIDDARDALVDGGADTGPAGATLGAVAAACWIQLGQIGEAEAALSLLATPGRKVEIDLPMLLEIRAQLRLAQQRPAEALQDALKAGRATADGQVPHPGAVPWRSTAALALMATGDLTGARELAQEELELAGGADLTRARLRALRVLGLATGGRRRLHLLAEAAELGAERPQRLEYVAALLDYGAAMRRANQPRAAREPLRVAHELSGALGARALMRRAAEELAVAGGRQRVSAAPGLAGLTPSERRVAHLAAGGRTTRQIAAELFVTPKTVEFHLRHVYRKLGLASSRSELIRALRGGESDDNT